MPVEFEERIVYFAQCLLPWREKENESSLK